MFRAGSWINILDDKKNAWNCGGAITAVKWMADLRIGDKCMGGVELLIFDKDGTLMDLHSYWSEMIRMRAGYLAGKYAESCREEACRGMMDAMGLEAGGDRIRPGGPVGIRRRDYIIEVTHRALMKYSDSARIEDVADAFLRVDEMSTGKIGEMAKPLPGVRGLLEGARRRGIKTAVATVDMKGRAELALSAMGIAGLFDFIAGGDMVEHAKPAPDLVELVEGKLGVGSGGCVVVGDSIADLEMAENAGCRFIGVKTGLYDSGFIRRCGNLAEDLNGISVC
jgi:phosphoglycolate phosphatase